MDIVIQTVTIIVSVLTVLTGAELKFFNVVTVELPCWRYLGEFLRNFWCPLNFTKMFYENATHCGFLLHNCCG